MSLLPSRPDAEPPDDAGPRVIGVESEDADEVLAALSSETARSLLGAVHEDPAPPSELADEVDTSLQNAQYHLEKLENAGAIEVVETAYSEKGREMDVYAPSDQPLVIYAGDEDGGSTLRTALSRVLGSLGILAFASLAIQAVYGEGLLPTFGGAGGDAAPVAGDGGGDGGSDAGGGDGGDGYDATGGDVTSSGDGGNLTTTGGDVGADDVATATETPSVAETTTPTAAGTETPRETMTATDTATETATPTPQATETATQSPDPTGTAFETAADGVTQTADAAVDAGAGLPPGLVFFAGGCFAIALVTVVLYVRSG